MFDVSSYTLTFLIYKKFNLLVDRMRFVWVITQF